MIAEIQIGRRKIQRIQKALYVNLPKVWTVNNNTRKGDVVDISISPDGSLRIAPATPCKDAASAASAPIEDVPACQT